MTSYHIRGRTSGPDSFVLCMSCVRTFLTSLLRNQRNYPIQSSIIIAYFSGYCKVHLIVVLSEIERTPMRKSTISTIKDTDPHPAIQPFLVLYFSNGKSWNVDVGGHVEKFIHVSQFNKNVPV